MIPLLTRHLFNIPEPYNLPDPLSPWNGQRNKCSLVSPIPELEEHSISRFAANEFACKHLMVDLVYKVFSTNHCTVEN